MFLGANSWYIRLKHVRCYAELSLPLRYASPGSVFNAFIALLDKFTAQIIYLRYICDIVPSYFNLNTDY